MKEKKKKKKPQRRPRKGKSNCLPLLLMPVWLYCSYRYAIVRVLLTVENLKVMSNINKPMKQSFAILPGIMISIVQNIVGN